MKNAITSIDILKNISDNIIRKQAMHNLLIQHDKEVKFYGGFNIVNKFKSATNTRNAISRFSFLSSKEGQDYWDAIFFNTTHL
jgi:hypothetical protein